MVSFSIFGREWRLMCTGDELEYVGGLGGSRFGFGGVVRKGSVGSSLTRGSEVDENEEMEMS